MMDWTSGDNFRDGKVGAFAIFLGFRQYLFGPECRKGLNVSMIAHTYWGP